MFLSKASCSEACKAICLAGPATAARKSMMRKFVIGYLADGGVPHWDEMSIGELQAICPDEAGHLTNLPQDECVSAMSMLILGRPDHGLLLSMWSCLFAGACAAGSEDSTARALEERGATVVETWLANNAGTGPRPVDLCGALAKRPR